MPFLAIFKTGNCVALYTLYRALYIVHEYLREIQKFEFFRLIKNSSNYGIIWDTKCRLHLGILFFKYFKIKQIEY